MLSWCYHSSMFESKFCWATASYFLLAHVHVCHPGGDKRMRRECNGQNASITKNIRAGTKAKVFRPSMAVYLRSFVNPLPHPALDTLNHETGRPMECRGNHWHKAMISRGVKDLPAVAPATYGSTSHGTRASATDFPNGISFAVS